MPAGIFISYRRDDSAGFAGRLYDRLAARYGATRVFMDIDTISPGHEFAADIERALSESVACIVLIGRRWESIALPDGRRRLDDPTDFVRLEVAAAIRRGVTVFPVLVEGASPPSTASLPEEIRPLSGRQAIQLSNERWNYDVGRLLLALDKVVGQPDTPHRPPRRRARTPALIAGAAIALSLIGAAGWFATRGTAPESAQRTTHSSSPSGTPTTSTTGPLCSPPVPGAPSLGDQLSGAYVVSMSLRCFTDETRGGNGLWNEPNPQVRVASDKWESQAWSFSGSSPEVVWVANEKRKGVGHLQPDGTYLMMGTAHCKVGPEADVLRTVVVTSADGPPAQTFQGWLTIHWLCDDNGPFDALFSVTGTAA